MRHPDIRFRFPGAAARRSIALRLVTLVAGLAVLGVALQPRTRAAAQQEAFPPVQVVAKGVHLRLADDLAIEIPSMRAEMIAVTAAQPPVLDDPSSFALRVASGQIAISGRSLATLINRYLVANPNVRARSVTVTAQGRMLKIAGRLGDASAARFTVTAHPRVTPDGRIALHVVRLTSSAPDPIGLPDLLGVRGEAAPRGGIIVTEAALLLSLPQALPPPAIDGHIAGVGVSGSGLVVTYASGTPGEVAVPPGDKGNYLHLRHGVLRFGKLTMYGADLRLIDGDPSDAFDFFPSEYTRQLAASRSEITPDYGVRARVPDFDSISGE